MRIKQYTQRSANESKKTSELFEKHKNAFVVAVTTKLVSLLENNDMSDIVSSDRDETSTRIVFRKGDELHVLHLDVKEDCNVLVLVDDESKILVPDLSGKFFTEAMYAEEGYPYNKDCYDAIFAELELL